MEPNAQASAAKPASQAFDFAGMGSMNSTTATTVPDDGYVPPVDSGVPAQPKSTTPATPVEEDDDDLVVGQPLDQTSGASQTTAPQAPVAATTGNAGGSAAGTGDTDNGNTADNDGSDNNADNDAGNDAGHDGAGGQVDPRMAQYMAQQKAAEQAGQRQGGGGGGSPGLSGLVMAAGSGAAALTVGGFKMLSNGVKAINGHDPSRPARKTIGEFLATRDPNNAEAYYSRAGDKVVSNRIYRDAYHGMHDNFVEAKAAEALFQEGVGEMRDILNNSDVKALADAADSSIGDYIHDVKSGKIVSAAATTAVQTLEQSTDFKAAESKIVSAGETFGQKQEAALAKMATLENSFPGKADTQMVKNELANLADGMKGDDVSKASAKVKKIMDDIEKMANAIKEAIRKTIDKVASLFQPK
ncbi:hypothetical protein [Rhizobium sp. BK176]|uniref:hypothetical protein n=1 Tax=Rhizobium sp. BK176 TaxID=2587071 RepID=UPI0021686D92|nr:hypothetical protein [Rhizobium sp. BK176]MCS4089841.1 hypothetical protein [Rhizobium sp. BK176]